MIIFCLSLNNEDLSKIKKLNYVPVGLGENSFHSDWLRDNTGDNISHKNKFYGEYTFHYWLWKNKLDLIKDTDWFGFCAYRRFWIQNKNQIDIKNFKDFLSTPQKDWDSFEVILGQEIFMNEWTFMKLLKHGRRSLINNPKFIYKKNRNLKFHFDSFHGYGNLDKAIELLEKSDRKDFANFMNTRNSFNRGNMLICNSPKILIKFYESIFPWLERCEKVFGFDMQSKSYGLTRIYAFLAERYLSFWFNKYSKVKIWPISFYDINKNEPG